MKKLIITSILTLASLNLLADGGEPVIHPLDTDKDGLISISEAKVDSTLSAIFTDLDVNQDGYLSSIELEVKTDDKQVS